jgi:hypothetical protein
MDLKEIDVRMSTEFISLWIRSLQSLVKYSNKALAT